MNNNAILIIPLRLDSSRFNNKALNYYNNLTLLENSIVIAKSLNFINEIVVAYSGEKNEKVIDICKKENIEIIYIEEDVSCGTEKVYYVNKIKDYKYYITLPVDEPAINFNELNRIWNNIKEDSITTLHCEFYNYSDLIDSRSCKIVESKNIIYTSRSVIPARKDGSLHDLKEYKKHIGVFIFPKKVLDIYGENIWKQNDLSLLEGLEQNMFLKFNFKSVKINHIGFGIDTYDQIEELEERMKIKSH